MPRWFARIVPGSFLSTARVLLRMWFDFYLSPHEIVKDILDHEDTAAWAMQESLWGPQAAPKAVFHLCDLYGLWDEQNPYTDATQVTDAFGSKFPTKVAHWVIQRVIERAKIMNDVDVD